MSAESKQTGETNLQPTAAAVAEALSDAEAESGDEEPSAAVDEASTSTAPAKKKKKKKSKTKKLKDAITGGSSKDDGAAGSSTSSKEITKSQSAGLEKLLDLNPGLKSELAGKNPEQLAALLSKMNIQDLLTGTVSHAFLSKQCCVNNSIQSDGRSTQVPRTQTTPNAYSREFKNSQIPVSEG